MRKTGCLIGFLILFCLVGVKQGFSQEEVFYDTFERENVDAWNLEEGWRIQQEEGNNFLRGKGHHWARLKIGEDWTDYRMQTRLMLLTGSVHLNVRVSNDGRYFVGFHRGRIYLNKEAPWGTFFTLKEMEADFDNQQWLDVEIVCKGGHIGISIFGRPVLEHEDASPLTGGTIAFESLEESEIIIDKVKVIAEFPIKPEVRGVTDLIIESLTSSPEDLVAGEEVSIFALVRNLGTQSIHTISVLFLIQESHEIGRPLIDSLEPGQAKIVKISGTINNPGENTIIAIVDPENHTQENNEDNNTLKKQIKVHEAPERKEPQEPIVEYTKGRTLEPVDRGKSKELLPEPNPKKTRKSWSKMLSAKYSEVVDLQANQEKVYGLQFANPARIHLQIYFYAKEPEKLTVQLIRGKSGSATWKMKGRKLYEGIGFINGQVSITSEMVKMESKWTIKLVNQASETASAEVLITVAEKPAGVK